MKTCCFLDINFENGHTFSEHELCPNFSGPKPNTLVDAVAAKDIPKEDLFYAVKCSVCSTSVGVYDSEEVYHFFNVLTGYA